ncbi:MAG: hypothetical protein ABJB34_01610 [Acidobacteriota bacterium]
MHEDALIKSETSDTQTICQLHAVLVRVFDVGVLMVGDSGSGKSECALELVTRGHRLVADDAVEIFVSEGRLEGRSPEVTRQLINIRGVGIMNVADSFGTAAVCERSVIDICVELRPSTKVNSIWDSVSGYKIAAARLPKFLLSVSTESNLAVLVERVVRVHRAGGSFGTASQPLEEHAGSRLLVH